MKRSLISHKVLGRQYPRGGVSGIKIFEEEVNFVAKLCSEGTLSRDHDCAGHLYLINLCPGTFVKKCSERSSGWIHFLTQFYLLMINIEF